MNDKIRNFSIVAHVDHGKSTLADAILMECKALETRDMKAQVLDSMDLEKERGITIKAKAVRLFWEKENMTFNLIDTPGHVDFSYEVKRAMAACDGLILLIDATQGVCAQTFAYYKIAKEQGLSIIPVLNKIDLPSANINLCLEQVDGLGLDLSLVKTVSAKTKEGVVELLHSVISMIPPPKSECSYLRALVIDSWYDPFLGIVTLVRIKDGSMELGSKLFSYATGKTFSVLKIGFYSPKVAFAKRLEAGEIGFIVTQLKEFELLIGDTIMSCSDAMNKENADEKSMVPLAGFKRSVPMVFCTFFAESSDLSEKTKEALEKYRLNDSAFSFSLENHQTYGMTFRCGFLGLLHLEIVKERLFREFDVKVTPTLPTVSYKIKKKSGELIEVRSPLDWPSELEYAEEPEVKCSVFSKVRFLGAIINLCLLKRAHDINQDIQEDQLIVSCIMPLSEVITDFNDRLQSVTSGYVSLEYEFHSYTRADLVKLFVMINEQVIDEFAMIVPRMKARSTAGSFAEKLKQLIPREQIKIKIQIAQNYPSLSNVIASATINPYMKGVIDHCSGGDVSRKKKLLDRQKEQKKNRGKFNSFVVDNLGANVWKSLISFGE